MSPAPTLAVIVVAAGDGTRLLAGSPKALVPLAGLTILEHALHAVFGMREPAIVVVVAPPADVEETRAIAERAAGVAAGHLRVIPGGSSRSRSVRAGLADLPSSVDTVLVHDAARALAPSSFLDTVTAAVRTSGEAVIPGLAVTDTIKQVDGTGAVVSTVDRDRLRAVQTPQGFPRDLLERAYADPDAEHTDDAATVAAVGGVVRIVPGDERAFKITTPWDLRRAELLVSRGDLRTGIGLDVHAFSEDGILRLAGLEWPGTQALSGHSDGDAVAHAIVDALLSAGGLGDIGSLFGTDDPRYAGAAGDVFLTGAVDALAEAGLVPVNVAVQLVGNRPRFSARRAEAESRLSGIVGAPVTIAATTTDGLGFTGRGEGVTAIATALVRAQAGPVLE
ncbi:2-C-methyl-D-erythritol 2,4-cyclodiphosphate synthase [Labedella gwakjiensis]|uniref:Bifunctional enzyme IspD/IspF n=1 Tax=Labedella gwakjiensis TaxID=390269 RepID=A0A2P8GRI6_9MICO|nr:2-C-methyl-D-erythritol 4-phosphate cytidylyltransferase [Labedella gwakjiensis]PSL36593.1 2-C-methyl-D-erythritol 2,4-cyclodiphosphate synthase [Labedella gwakjiensis]RUQ85499.1 2-C-methyl-D-erythritol 4-phosphate cytidylyltransferase [Labedella gwakjiensis]